LQRINSCRQPTLSIASTSLTTRYSITATKEGGPIKNLIGKALVERIVRAAKEGKHFKVWMAT